MGYPGPADGSIFLVSQSHYVQGINCSKAELHFVCTERFDDDWRAFLAEFGVAPRQSLPRLNRHNGTHRIGSLAYGAQMRSRLSQEDKDYVRNVLYPWDTALYSWACERHRTRARLFAG